MQQRVTGEFGISSCEMVDYATRKISIPAPQVMQGLINPQFGHAYLVPGCSLLGRGGSKLIFKLNEESVFTRLWASYPPRASPGNLQLPQKESSVDETKISQGQ
jgi:hypothetical protein